MGPRADKGPSTSLDLAQQRSGVGNVTVKTHFSQVRGCLARQTRKASLNKGYMKHC